MVRRFLPDTSVSGRLLTLLVACVIVPGAALGYFGVRAVLHEDVLQEAQLQSRASALGTVVSEQLELRAQLLRERLTVVRDDQAERWLDQPTLAAKALVEAEPRVLATIILGGERYDELVYPLTVGDDSRSHVQLVLAVPEDDRPTLGTDMALWPLRAGATRLMLAESLSVSPKTQESARIILVLSGDILRADAEDLLSSLARSNPEFRTRLLEPRTTVNQADWTERLPVEARHSLDRWLPGYTLSIYRGEDSSTHLSWTPQRIVRLAVIGFLMVLIVIGMIVLIHGVSQEIEVARLKSDFLSNVSHELRTPLTTIRIMAEMLSLGAVPSGEKQAEYHSNIVSEAERLSRLINNVLDFARIHEGRKKFQFGIGDLGDIVYEVEQIIGDYVKREGFELTTNVQGALPPASFDRDAMVQALINLTSNAVKYTEDDRRIEIGARAERDTILLWVADHGPGIDPKEIPHLFEKFFRGGDHMTREVGGTGLGLAIVQHIVAAHGGTVSVRSELGEGSTFEIRLPVGAGTTATAV
ncbi:MAG TPA: hypothetical protein DIU15_12515 [Deltaproteobacteria bacterium]|nr:hypothetical protein [Deltaproteobacteria bacterium]HCP46861.1 hypothetical protein [Deltaproteobacteria bacterium]